MTVHPVNHTLQQRELSLEKFYEYTARQIEREESLINRRLSWMLTFQGFLFAAIALLANKDVDSKIRVTLSHVVPMVGMLVAVLSFIGVLAAYLSINDIKAKWQKRSRDHHYPPAFGTTAASRLGRIPSYGLPLSIFMGWLALLILIGWWQT